MMSLQLTYYFKGSTNCELHFIQEDTITVLKTDYNETIAIVQSVRELCIVIDELASGKYA